MHKKLINLGCVYVELTPNQANQFHFKRGRVISFINNMYHIMTEDGAGPYNLYTNQIKEVIIDTKELSNTVELLNDIGVENIKDTTSFQDLMSAYILKKINSQPDDVARLKFISELTKNGFSI